MSENRDQERYTGVERRVQQVGFAIAAALFLLGIQLWRLQILSLSEFSKLAEDNRIWQKRLAADRGIIYARDGQVMADNRARVDVVIIPGECPAEMLDTVCERLQSWINIDPEDLHKKIEAYQALPFTQILVKRDISRADQTRVEENQHLLPGITTVVHPQRRYLLGETAGQIMGFLGEISPVELERRRDEGYFMGDLVGKGGIELFYESLLHGQDGYMLVTKYASGQPQLRTDKAGRPMIARRDTIGHLLNLEAPPVPARSGEALNLTLDIDLQQKCESLLKGEQGSIVVLDADTGAVLALASAPGYDPSVFVNRGATEERLTLLSGQKPNRMTHRAFREVYPPGSVFKIMLAAAGLEEKLIDANTRFHCSGSYAIDGKGRRWNCWNRYGHGSMNVVESLAFSCDVFFYTLGRRLEVDRIVAYSKLMGMGVLTGLDITGESAGLIPGREWKAAMNKDKPAWEQQWYPGETVNLSIGQGSCTTTPLQITVMMACIVNGGYRVQPYLRREAGPILSDKIFSDSTIDTVTAGLRMCVERTKPAPTGTGNRARIEGMDIIGKTGTAQVASLSHLSKYKKTEDIPYPLRHHAWFTAGVLDRSPRIAVTVLIEHGHAGGSVAAPVARDVIEYFYDHAASKTSYLTLAGN
ncbi:MAG: penicillin-binding protein 2 [Candidatus Hydrogenedens sp.]|jgi:penicillin-binding protein 2|nr:penicillin-binding protein 2 [Candidatus Hydrogenedens sp.]